MKTSKIMYYNIVKISKIIFPVRALYVARRFFDRYVYHKNRNQILKVFNCLADDDSKRTYQAYIKYRRTGKTASLKQVSKDIKEQYFDNTVFRLSNNEIFVDIGALDAENSICFAKLTNYQYHKIILFEPDKKSYENAKKNIIENDLNDTFIYNEGCFDYTGEVCFAGDRGANSKITYETVGASIKVTTLDDKLKQREDIESIIYIKMDIEGAEYEALRGSVQTIARYKPRLAICIYHKSEDIYKLPLFIKEILPEYKLFIRHYSALESRGTNSLSLSYELVCYAIYEKI